MRDKQANSDMKRFGDEVGKLGVPVSARSYDEIDPDDATIPRDGNRTAFTITIGMRGELNHAKAKKSARVWQRMAERYHKGIFYLQIAGYDDDPRELWEIKETRKYIGQWARFAGLDRIDIAVATPLDPDWIAVLAKCGAFRDSDPDLPIRGGP